MPPEMYYVVVGVILVMAASMQPLLRTRPVTSAMVYLLTGMVLSVKGLGLLFIDPITHSLILEHVAEMAVVTSLFVCGMKLQLGWKDPLWRLPLRLAFVSMTVTVVLVSLAGFFLLGLPLGVAIILGAILAPTDPVLASDVQVEHESDRDKVRFSLTGEAGFNDGAAFPFLYLGMGLLGLHQLGSWGWRWWLVDVLWGVLGGLAIGAVLGMGAGRALLTLRDEKSREGVHEFLALGLVFLAYGTALAFHTHGFLAAFSAGLMLRWAEDTAPDDEVHEAGGAMSPEVLGFKEQVERLLEALTVILVGALMMTIPWDPAGLWFIPLLFFVLRPVSVRVGLWRAELCETQKPYLSWFGIRGIGSVYYLAYAVNHGLDASHGRDLSGLVFPVLALSIVLHGLSVTPLMEMYRKKEKETA